jgi:hypothetical protein
VLSNHHTGMVIKGKNISIVGRSYLQKYLPNIGQNLEQMQNHFLIVLKKMFLPDKTGKKIYLLNTCDSMNG